jgi:cytochrome b
MREPEPSFKFAPEVRVVPVWDLGIRFFHWALVILVTTSVVTIKLDAITWHQWSGYGVLTLLIFRLLWGIFGGTHARFANFVAGPGKVLGYLKGIFNRKEHGGWLGHNPIGALSVLAMLASLLFQAVSGLFTNDDDFSFEGPLYKWAGKEISDQLTHLHHLNATLIYVLVGLHVAAILFYLVYHRDNLVGPMLTGYRKVTGPAPDARHGSTALAAVLLALSAAAVYCLVNAIKFTS